LENNDIIAFGNLFDRSLTEDNKLLDRIAVRDYIINAEIGAFQSERGKKQRLRISVVLEVELNTEKQNDDVDKIISYDTIIDAIKNQLLIERINLLETFAERIAAEILKDANAKRAFVRVEKLDRIPGALGVEIVRTSDDNKDLIAHQEQHNEILDAPSPFLVFITNDIINSNELVLWLDALERIKSPVVICVEGLEKSYAFSKNKMAQRRIDLLEIEQNAWLLAGKDERCVVVSTRTELDWAIKNHQISIWAPSKIVLDAVNKPISVSAIDLAAWFSSSFAGSQILILGKKMFKGFVNIKRVTDL
tara:strand:+ start:31 stop:948 length:918 start_codon:yes stop_codon:yes gene_type:complete